MLLWAFGSVHAAVAQTVNYLAPPGGLTIKDVVIQNNALAFITFQESVPELSACESTTWGGVTYTNPVWLEFTGAYENPQTARLTYNTALAAFMMGRKLAGVNWRRISTWCDAYALRLGP